MRSHSQFSTQSGTTGELFGEFGSARPKPKDVPEVHMVDRMFVDLLRLWLQRQHRGQLKETVPETETDNEADPVAVITHLKTASDSAVTGRASLLSSSRSDTACMRLWLWVHVATTSRAGAVLIPVAAASLALVLVASEASIVTLSASPVITAVKVTALAVAVRVALAFEACDVVFLWHLSVALPTFASTTYFQRQLLALGLTALVLAPSAAVTVTEVAALLQRRSQTITNGAARGSAALWRPGCPLVSASSTLPHRGRHGDPSRGRPAGHVRCLYTETGTSEVPICSNVTIWCFHTHTHTHTH